jgi:hypothetical protein
MANYKTQTNLPLETENLNTHALISWRSIVAGLLVALFSMVGFIGLGLAVGGINMDAETSIRSVGLFSGIWFLVSSIISLFIGSYFAARISKFRTGRLGSAQGVVIAALFLGLFLYQTLSLIGSAGSAAGNIIGKTGSLVAVGANNPGVSTAVGNITENALGDLNLRSDPGVVAQGVATRLVRGDADGAKNYLARQARITPTEADARIAQLRIQVDKVVSDAK